MKKISSTLIIMLLLAFVARGQSVKDVEDTMLFYSGKIEQYNVYSHVYDSVRDTSFAYYDSLYFYNEALKHYLVRVLEAQPLTLTAKFEKMGVKISSSQDKKFRIYWWDEESGGTMRGYYSIVQYKTSKGVKADVIYPKQDTNVDMSEDKDAPGFFYPEIYSVHTKNHKTYYLVKRIGVYSNSDFSTGIRAFTIENDKINDSIKIFRAKKDYLNSIDYEHSWVDDDQTIKMNKDNRKLYIPIVNRDLSMTNKYLVYVFDGNNYVFDKNAK